MRPLRDLLDKQAKIFEEGGPLHAFHALYEAPDTLFFTPGEVTEGKTHVRDALDLKRLMITVVLALIPCIVMAVYNTGYQANAAISGGSARPLEQWQTDLFIWITGGDFTPHIFNNLLHGTLYFIPVLLVTFIVGGNVEAIFAVLRKHEINEGFLVTGILFPLILPPTIPLWQVAIGVVFAVVLCKEVFGGTGMNILNVALTARAFLFFAYPAQISGNKVWVAANMVDAESGATWLARASESPTALPGFGSDTWWDAFLGFIPGSMGETSTFAALIGAIILIATGIGSWRTMAGIVVGTVATVLLLNGVGSADNSMFAVPFYWHFVLGGWAFGMVFMATDPVTSAFTEGGKWIYGIGIGLMVVLVRVVNPAYPEGMMLAILFMNMFAPFIDHFFVQNNIKRRLVGYGVQ